MMYIGRNCDVYIQEKRRNDYAGYAEQWIPVITHPLRIGRVADSIWMNRDDLQRLSKDDLIELVLRLQCPDKTSRTSSKPPSTDRKERREQAKPGGAQPGHEGHSRKLCETPDAVE